MSLYIIYTLHGFDEASVMRTDIVYIYHVFVANRLTGVQMDFFICENDSVLLFYKRLQHLCLKIYA